MPPKSIPFTKMAGAGNDFIVIDAQKGLNYPQFAKNVCDRNKGLGADGILIYDKSKSSDYRMRIVNADGSEAEMCGNGARCIASYITRFKNPRKKLFTIETLAGTLLASAKDEIADVRLSDPKDYRPKIALDLSGRKINVHYIDTGVPHTIVFVDKLNEINVNQIGPTLRYHPEFQPRGTNANFVEQMNNGLVAVRTYERGVEAETRACGTGSVAAAIVSYLLMHPQDLLNNKTRASMRVLTKSGEILKVTFDLIDQKITNVWLNGSAKFIAQGLLFIK